MPDLVQICSYLRTKNAYGDVVSAESPRWAEAGDHPTDCYWCLKTMQAWGPDSAPASLSSCGPERSCCDAREIEVA
jgi:hypothetical protein